MADWLEVYLNECFPDPEEQEKVREAAEKYAKELSYEFERRIIEKMEREIMKPNWAQE